MAQHCWDRSRGHHGPCCMDCVIAETDRRAGAVPESPIREMQIWWPDGDLMAVVRSCCFHWDWMHEAVEEALAMERLCG